CMPAKHAQTRNMVFHKGACPTRYSLTRGGNMSSTIEQIEAVAGGVSVRQLFEKQKAYFESDVTKSYEWRVDQLDRLIRMLTENFERFSEASRIDFKTALQENIFEFAGSVTSIEFTKSQLKTLMKPVEATLPNFLTPS